MSLKLTTMAAACILAAAATTARAEPSEGWHHGFGPAGHHDGGYMELPHGISLTDAQKTQIRDIEHAGWTEMKSGFEQMRAIHEQITTLLVGSAAVSKDQIETLMRQEEQLRSKADKARMDKVLAVRAILTPDQLAQAASFHQHMEALHDQEHQLMHPTAQ